MNLQVSRRRKSRAIAKRIRNRRARRKVLATINNSINEVTQSLSNLPPAFSPPSFPQISSLILEERFPFPSRYDLVFPISFPLSLSSPIHDSPPSVTTAHLLLDISPPSPSHSSTPSVEFLDEILAPSSRLQFHSRNYPWVHSADSTVE